MPRSTSHVAFALFLSTAACGGSNDSAGRDSSVATSDAAPAPATASTARASFSSAELDSYERGLAREIEVVRAAKERERTASTPQERGAAAQAQWEDQTIPEGAKGAGLSAERYREIRTAVHDVLQTLDFQGKIEGPLSIDTARAAPEMKARLARDAYAELDPSSAEALRARMDSVLPRWVEYITLTAVAG